MVRSVAPLGPLVVTPFGWGTGAADYDNDGDTDIIFFGNLMVNPFQSADNPGVILQNQSCTATSTRYWVSRASYRWSASRIHPSAHPGASRDDGEPHEFPKPRAV